MINFYCFLQLRSQWKYQKTLSKVKKTFERVFLKVISYWLLVGKLLSLIEDREADSSINSSSFRFMDNTITDSESK